MTMDLAPTIPRETDAVGMAVYATGFDVNTRQVISVNSDFATSARIDLAQRLVSSGTLTYTLHPTQQLFSGNQGSRFYIQVIDYISFGGDRSMITVEFGWDPTVNGGVVQVYDDMGTKVGEYQQAGFLEMLTEIKFTMSATTRAWDVKYKNIFVGGGSFPTDAVAPYKIRYGYYKLGGQPQSVTWPSGHPANGQVWTRWLFVEAALAGTWAPFEPTWTAIPLNSSGVQIGTTVSNPTAINYVSNLPVASFTVPNASGIAFFRIRGRYHFSNSSALGWPYLDIPVTGGTAPPLTVSGSNPVSLEPGATYNVVANYPTSELTFAAIGGGSFGSGATANVYTAPADHGTSATYSFTVTRGAEVVTVGVNVFLRLTPPTASMIGGTTQVFTANADVTSWNVTGGSLSGSAARSRTYTAPASVGTFNVSTVAVTGGATTSAIVTVTSSGATPTTGLRLEPSAGYSVSLNSVPVVQMIGDLSPALWAQLINTSIDGATGNIRIQSNSATSEAHMAQAIDAVSTAPISFFEWTFNSTMIAAPGDSCQHVWELRNEAGQFRMSVIFSYNGTGESWNVAVYTYNFGQIYSANFTRTDTTGFKLDLETTASLMAVNVSFRASSAGSWVIVATPTFAQPQSNLPTYFVYKFNPSIASQSNGAVIIAKPVLTGGWARWVAPNWTASRIDGSGNIIGSYPVTPGEDATYTSGSRARTAAVFCNAVGTARVRASYPSGVTAVNDVLITISSSGTGLAVTTPAAGVTTDINPGATLTVEANDAPAALTYSCPGGTFGSTAGTKNVFTAGALAGNYTLTVSRGSEVVTRTIRVLMRVTPATQSLPFSSSAFLDVNTNTAISFSATGGTVSLVSISGGVSRLLYTSGTVAGTYTVNVTSSINNATATVTVVASGTTPIVISNAEPIIVEPGIGLSVLTNYPAAENTYSATGGTFLASIWFAPSQAGNYTLTVSHPIGGVDTAVAKVPLRLSPKSPPAVNAGGQVQFSANFPTITWLISNAAGGAISTSGLWTAGATPGSYTITARATVSGTITDDTTTVTIQGAGLALNHPSSITMLPGSQITITANFPTSELTFSATGGTFGTGPTANVYTAPANAGGYTITVTRAGQTATIAVTVPVVITPSSITLGQSTAQVFTVNADVVNFATTGWAATGGVLTVPAIRTATYTSGTTAGSYTVTAITTLGTIVASITNTGSASVPIVITGPDAVTIEPNSTYLVTTNKPTGTYSLTATGGTFEGNQYRAPSQAGTYTITVADTSGSGGGSDTLAVTVPLRISPSNPTVLPGVGQQFTVNAPSGDVTWSVSGGPGGIGTGAGAISITGNWTGTITPGTYTIHATTPTASATTQVTVTTLELVVYGPSDITLEPGANYTVFTNYAARNASYSAFGGSFTSNVYTAPQAAGDYYFTVSVPGQTKRVDVHVPVRISPDEVRLEAGQSFQFTVNAPSATWSATSGTISSTGFYTAPAGGGTIAHISATTPSGSDTAIVLFLDEFPYQPNYTLEGELNRTVIVVEAEDGTRFGRAKGPVRRSYSLKFQNRHKEEVEAALAFWRGRYPERPFLFNDMKLGDFTAVLFDSAIRWEVSGSCLYAYSFRIIEV